MISFKHFTLGVEEEYMVIDPVTKELRSHEQSIVTEGQKVIRDKVKAEMHQAVVEVGTDICADIHEARKDISTLRSTISRIAGDLGFKAFDTAVGQIGTLICWDQWYPEAARITALRGANLLFYPTAIGWHPAEKEPLGEAQHPLS